MYLNSKMQPPWFDSFSDSEEDPALLSRSEVDELIDAVVNNPTVSKVRVMKR